MKTKIILSTALVLGTLSLCTSCENYFDEKYMGNGDPQITDVRKSMTYTMTEDEVAGLKETDSSKWTNGIFSANVSRYPLAVPVKLEAYPPEGASYTLASFNHIGGEITVPYAVPHGTTLALSVLNQEKERLTVQ